MDATSPSSDRILAFIFRPISAAGPNSRWLAVTSRKASSIDSGSIRSVYVRRIPRSAPTSPRTAPCGAAGRPPSGINDTPG